MLADVVLAFDEGFSVETAEDAKSADYEDIVEQLEGLEAALESLAEVPVAAARASAIEFVLEGLHLHKLLNKKSGSGRSTFTG
jgi:magnesium chelatase subunit I